MPSLARPEVDVLDGLTTAIIGRPGADGREPRSTVGNGDRRDAMLRSSSAGIAKPHVGPADGVLVQRAEADRDRFDDRRQGRGEKKVVREPCTPAYVPAVSIEAWGR